MFNFAISSSRTLTEPLFSLEDMLGVDFESVVAGIVGREERRISGDKKVFLSGMLSVSVARAAIQLRRRTCVCIDAGFVPEFLYVYDAQNTKKETEPVYEEK